MLRRIKPTQLPRLALAAIALLVFFVTMYFHLIQQPIDFHQPFWAGVMVAFLFLGIAMLVASWVIGLDTRAEIYITLFMMGLHIVFDFYIFWQVFILQREIPVFLVQAVVQAYWVAGLIDVVFMFGAANWQRTAPEYVSPEQEVVVLRQQIAILTATTEVAQRKHEATCEKCGKVLRHSTLEGLEKALWGHKPHCKGNTSVALSSNGHKQREVING